MKIQGKVALVTGASRGIGAATAKLLAAHGVAVGVNYFNSKAPADAVVEDIKAGGGKALAVQADCRNEAQVGEMVTQTVNALGPVDILVLNAGMNVPFKSFMELSYEEFETKVMGELQCFFYPLKAAVPGMIERKSGCIIGISSGLSRYPGYGFSAHTTVKSGIDGLMKSLALELGPAGIRVNTVAPGLTKTDATAHMPPERVDAIAQGTPLRRVGLPEDVAGAVVMLCREEARFVSGTYVPVSGGIQMP